MHRPKATPVVKYVGTYFVYIIIVNQIVWMIKQKGIKMGPGWEKAKKFPYFDNWTATHMGWSIIAAMVGIKPGTFLLLNLGNEFILEPLLAYGHNAGISYIMFASEHDPFWHKVADAAYSQATHDLVYYAIADTIKDVNKEVEEEVASHSH